MNINQNPFNKTQYKSGQLPPVQKKKSQLGIIVNPNQGVVNGSKSSRTKSIDRSQSKQMQKTAFQYSFDQQQQQNASRKRISVQLDRQPSPAKNLFRRQSTIPPNLNQIQRKNSLIFQENNNSNFINSQQQTITKIRIRKNSIDSKALGYLEQLKQTGKERKKELEQIRQQALNHQFKDQKYKYKNAQKNQFEDEFKFPNQSMYLKNEIRIKHSPKVLNIRYDKLDMTIGVACDDGIIRLYSENKGNLLSQLYDETERLSAVTSIRWHPIGLYSNLLLATYQSGAVTLYDTTTLKIKERFEQGSGLVTPQKPIKQQNNNFTQSNNNKNKKIFAKDVCCCDFSCTGQNFATGGYDQEVKIYDTTSNKVKILNSGKIPKHNNRIYAVKYLPNDPNILLTAGWDNTVLIWDTRVGTPQGYIHGPQICGDSLDISQNKILTGSWRNENQLEIFDLRKLDQDCSIPWEDLSQKDQEQNYIYAAKFSKYNTDYILAGSTGSHELRMFDRVQNNKFVDYMRDKWDKGIYTIDFAHDKNTAIYGCADGSWGQVNFI